MHPPWQSGKPDNAETPGRARLTDEAWGLMESHQRVEQGAISVEVDGAVLGDFVRLRVSKHAHFAKKHTLNKKTRLYYSPNTTRNSSGE